MRTLRSLREKIKARHEYKLKGISCAKIALRRAIANPAGENLLVYYRKRNWSNLLNTKTTNSLLPNKSILLIAFAVGLFLLLVSVAMRFTDGEGWSPFDYIFAGTFLFGTGLAFELVSRRARTLEYRAALGAALVGAFLLIWINLAVGIIGSEDNPANLMYFGVLALLGLGTLLALLRPLGMARALFATALAHAIVSVVAVLITPWSLDSLKTLALNLFFVALWAASAWLFRRCQCD